MPSTGAGKSSKCGVAKDLHWAPCMAGLSHELVTNDCGYGYHLACSES